MKKIDIALEQLQLYDTSNDFPASFKLISNSFISWYQNINKDVQFNNAHKFLTVRSLTVTQTRKKVKHFIISSPLARRHAKHASK